MQMMIRFSLLLVVCLLAGCSTAPAPAKVVSPAVVPMRKASAGEIKKRCAALKALLSPLAVREAGFSHRAFSAGFSPEEVCRFVTAAGFNRIALQLSSVSELDEKFSAFLKAAKKEKLAVDIMLEQEDFRQYFTGKGLLRRKSADSDLAEVLREIGAFNSDLSCDQAKISRVIVKIAPHRFVSDTRGSSGQIFAWSEKNAGPGLDNDMLMLRTLEMLKNLDVPGIEIAVAVPDFYHELVLKGKITRGKATDFLTCRKGKVPVIIMSSGNKPSQIVSRSRNEFMSAGKNHELLLGIELAGHTSRSSGKLRRRDWRDLTRILDYVIREHKKYPAFRGVMLMPLPVLQYLIMEQD